MIIFYMFQKPDNISEIFLCAKFRSHEILEGESIVKVFKVLSLFILAAVALGFFSSIGIWAAVSFLRLFGIDTL